MSRKRWRGWKEEHKDGSVRVSWVRMVGVEEALPRKVQRIVTVMNMNVWMGHS